MYSQKTRFGQEMPHVKPGVDYPIKIHISGTHYRVEYVGSGQAENALYADAVMNGKKIELTGDREEVPFQNIRLPLGDYQARLLKDPHKMGDLPIFQVYEVALPDKTAWRCTVTGMSE
jgi:hypothetical protein